MQCASIGLWSAAKAALAQDRCNQNGHDNSAMSVLLHMCHFFLSSGETGCRPADRNQTSISPAGLTSITRWAERLALVWSRTTDGTSGGRIVVRCLFVFAKIRPGTYWTARFGRNFQKRSKGESQWVVDVLTVIPTCVRHACAH